MKTSIYDLSKLKKILSIYGYSIPEFALKIGQTKANIYDAIKRNRPSQGTLENWAAGLGITTLELDRLLKVGTEIRATIVTEAEADYKKLKQENSELRIERLESEINQVKKEIDEKKEKGKG